MNTSFLSKSLLLCALAVSLTNAAHAKDADWTVFQLPPCALADIKVIDSKTIRLNARGAKRQLGAQGGDQRGCSIPNNAQALLVDMLVDTSKDRSMASTKRKARSLQPLMKVKSGFTARTTVVELCAARGCKSDIAIRGLQKDDRLRVFVRGYLMEGQQYASTELTAELAALNPQRVIDCEVWHGPDGEIYRIGTDCSLDYSGVPHGSTNDDPPGDDDVDEPLAGCPYEYFDEDEWSDDQTHFRFPVSHPEWIFPTAIHLDHDPGVGWNPLACSPWFTGLPCYDGHEGSDFSLIGSFWKQDDKSVYAVAAADGVVMATRENRYDRCEADINPSDCSAQVCGTFAGVTVCSGCVPNVNFGQPFCQEGDETRRYDELQANYVRLCHADGTISRYLHLMRNEVDVEPGDKVDCGDRLGLIGSSGRSSAPHLHFDVTHQDLGAWIDPFDAGSGESLWVEPALPGLLPGTGCQ